MNDWILANAQTARLGAFLGVLVLMALWELVAARRELGHSRGRRWLANLGLSVAGSFLVRLIFPAAAMGVALLAERERWGLLNHYHPALAVKVLLSIVVLDLAIYFQHVLFHAVPIFWRLHKVHHTDQDVDASTGIRFHPVEILVSMVIKFAVVAALGPPPVAVVLFAILLNATSIFNHANVRLPRAVERPLRWILVTPDMHRVHHSVEVDESNSNFGFNLPWWDRLFGTYRAQPRAGHLEMELGVSELQRPRARGLVDLLALPFRRSAGQRPADERAERDAGS